MRCSYNMYYIILQSWCLLIQTKHLKVTSKPDWYKGDSFWTRSWGRLPSLAFQASLILCNTGNFYLEVWPFRGVANTMSCWEDMLGWNYWSSTDGQVGCWIKDAHKERVRICWIKMSVSSFGLVGVVATIHDDVIDLSISRPKFMLFGGSGCKANSSLNCRE